MRAEPRYDNWNATISFRLLSQEEEQEEEAEEAEEAEEVEQDVSCSK